MLRFIISNILPDDFRSIFMAVSVAIPHTLLVLGRTVFKFRSFLGGSKFGLERRTVTQGSKSSFMLKFRMFDVQNFHVRSKVYTVRPNTNAYLLTYLQSTYYYRRAARLLLSCKCVAASRKGVILIWCSL